MRAPAPALAKLSKPKQSSHSLLNNIIRGSSLARPRKGPCPVGRKSVGDVKGQPLRERVMHLLALRPYKRPELILRLQKDGMTEGDKDVLDSIISEVKMLLSSRFVCSGCECRARGNLNRLREIGCLFCRWDSSVTETAHSF